MNLRLYLTLAVIFTCSCAAGDRLPTEHEHPSRDTVQDFRLGCQAWSFKKFTFFDAVDKTASLGLDWIEAHPGQRLSDDFPGAKLDHNMAISLRKITREKLQQAGVRLIAYGVVRIDGDPKDCHKIFEFARDMGIDTINTEPPPEAMDLVEKYCIEYGIKLGIHNHPKPSRYWNPDKVLEVCSGRSPLIGACADTGHWMRSGINPVEALKKLEGRLASIHLKDLDRFGDKKAHDVVWGTGVADIRAILAELDRQGFSGSISIEYEYNWENSMPEIRKCVDYYRTAAGLYGTAISESRSFRDSMETEMDRRTFMQSSLAAASSLYFSTSAMGSQAAGDDINLALLGAGAQGQVLLNACLKIPNVRFKAVCDIWTDYNQRRVSRLLSKYGHEHNDYVDYRQMLATEKDLDAVIIATPDFWHARHTIACLEAGLHVYCEKEMSNKLEDARKMVEAAARTGKLLQIGHQRRSNPRYLHCYNKLIKDAGLLGRITTVNGQWNRAAKPDLGWPKKYAVDEGTLAEYGFESMEQFRNWRWYKNLGGGPIVDLGSHQIDIYNWFLGSPPTAVIASGGTDYYDAKTHQWYDTVMAIYRYDTPQGTVRAAYQTLTTNSYGGYYEVFMGDQGTLLISEASGRAGIYPEQSAPDWEQHVKTGILNAPKQYTAKTEEGVAVDVRETPAPPSYELPIEFNDPYHKPHLENFFEAIRGKARLNCPAEVGYETAVTVLKVNEAVEAGRQLAFDSREFKV